MERNNGKIAIAIVAMFVAAISIIGVTYAFFVARVQGQGTTDVRTVNVQAGTLKIAYGNGATLLAKNIVPGWISDGDKYYDPIHSTTVGDDGKTHITAASVTTVQGAGKTVTSVEDGATVPVSAVTFTIDNESTTDETAYYGIRLKDVSNGLYAKEPDNFLVTIKSLTSEGYVAATIVNGKLASDYKLTDATTQNVSGVLSITGDVANKFEVSAQYVETGAEQTGTGAAVSFTVEVVGLNLVNGEYVDYNGTPWTGLTA